MSRLPIFWRVFIALALLGLFSAGWTEVYKLWIAESPIEDVLMWGSLAVKTLVIVAVIRLVCPEVVERTGLARGGRRPDTADG